MEKKKMIIGVIGGHSCSAKTAKLARELGKEIAKLGAILVCGGLSGVMEAAAQGAKENGGITVGLLPGADKGNANKFIDIPLATGLGYTRNTLVATASDIIIALPGEYGTLSEIGFALNAKKPVVGIGSWDIRGMLKASSAKQAISIIKRRALHG